MILRFLNVLYSQARMIANLLPIEQSTYKLDFSSGNTMYKKAVRRFEVTAKKIMQDIYHRT